MNLSVGARSSPLSRAQVQEVFIALRQFYPHVSFDILFVETYGDKDLKTSLRNMGKTDFFTAEVDRLLLSGMCRIGIHSAKDLPDPLTAGLELIALTKGLDSADVLVLREGERIDTLAPGSVIATSSERREDSVRLLRSDVQFVDIRGTIEQRLEKISSGTVAGVVVAEAALIRLGLTHLNRVRLPGPTVPYQGQLAILARIKDREMQRLFACLDSREDCYAKKQVLYLGLEAPEANQKQDVIHYPVIKVVPRSVSDEPIQKAFQQIDNVTHLIFTSKNAVRIFFQYAYESGIATKLQQKSYFAVGQATARALFLEGLSDVIIAQNETAEGLVDTMHVLESQQDPYLLWPHAAGARTVIADACRKKGWKCLECVLYDTVTHQSAPKPSLDTIDEIVFTSPSTVDAFLHIYGELPLDKQLTCIGPITQSHLMSLT